MPQEVGSRSTTEASVWARLSSTLRTVDVEKVKGYTKSIDTILVFAGLYSAVLTALLVESYKTLREESKETMIFLLRQLIIQTSSFIVNDRFVNSTFTPPVLEQSFQLSSQAKWINGLWFTSLTLSLVSASFCIFVKQWLLEIPCQEDMSPRAHLRIRYFRHSGITTYKVFEIAACLPLLLQIALLLFFVGLCIFTANAYQRIGDAALSLVVAWAFLLVATTLLPCLDPKCPYKVPLLTATINWIRRPALGSRSSYYSSYAEEKAAKNKENDNELLLDALRVDAIQADDQLLKDIMLQAINDGTRPENLSKLPLKVIDYRMQSGEAARLLHSFLDMTLLSEQTYQTITSMIILLLETQIAQPSAAEQHSRSSSSSAPDWLESSVCALLSLSTFPFSDPKKVHKVFHSYLSEHSEYKSFLPRVFKKRGKPSNEHSLFPYFKKLQGAFELEQDSETLLRLVHNFVHALTSDLSSPPPFPRPVSTYLDSDLFEGYNDCRNLLYDLLRKRCEKVTDPRIILLFDAFLLDNAFLKALWYANIATQNNTPSEQADFIVGVLKSRLPSNVLSETMILRTLNWFPDLSEVRADDYDTIMELAATFIETRLPYGPQLPKAPLIVTWDVAVEGRIISILLSDSGRRPLPEVAHKALSQCFSERCFASTADIIAQRIAYKAPTTQGWGEEISKMLEGLRDSDVLFDSDTDPIPFLERLFAAMPLEQNGYRPLVGGTARADVRNGSYAFKVPEPCETAVLDLLAQSIERTKPLGVYQEEKRRATSEKLLSAMFQIAADNRLEAHPSLTGLVTRLLTPSQQNTPLYRAVPNFGPAASQQNYLLYRVVLDSGLVSKAAKIKARQYFIDCAKEIRKSSEISSILSSLEQTCREHISSAGTSSFSDSDSGYSSADTPKRINIDPLATCLFLLQLLDSLPFVSNISSYWIRLFKTIIEALVGLDEEDEKDYSKSTVIQCLSVLTKIKTTSPVKPPIPSSLETMLLALNAGY